MANQTNLWVALISAGGVVAAAAIGAYATWKSKHPAQPAGTKPLPESGEKVKIPVLQAHSGAENARRNNMAPKSDYADIFAPNDPYPLALGGIRLGTRYSAAKHLAQAVGEPMRAAGGWAAFNMGKVKPCAFSTMSLNFPEQVDDPMVRMIIMHFADRDAVVADAMKKLPHDYELIGLDKTGFKWRFGDLTLELEEEHMTLNVPQTRYRDEVRKLLKGEDTKPEDSGQVRKDSGA